MIIFFQVVMTIVGILVVLGVPVYGAVIARRSYRRSGWPETRLAFRAFVAMLVITLAGAFTIPIIGWLSRDVISLNTLLWSSAVFSAASSATFAFLAIALYRLARRGAEGQGSKAHDERVGGIVAGVGRPSGDSGSGPDGPTL